MAVANMDVRAVARLARLELSDEEVETFSGQLGRVIEHIAQLECVDTTGVEPTAHASAVFNVVREDEVRPSLAREDFLGITPRNANHLVIVPKVIE